MNIASILKPNTGKVFFRDYAVGDLAEERLQKQGRQKKLGPNFYVRGDGTTCHYFSEVGGAYNTRCLCGSRTVSSSI